MFRIETAKITQIPEIIEVNKASKIISYDLNYYAYLLINNPDLNFVVKNNKNQIIGFILTCIRKKVDSASNKNLDFPIGHVVSFAVAEEYRNKKLGTKLMNKFLANLKNNYKIKQAYLEMEVGNRAISFYQRNGFTEKEKLKDYYDSGDGILMVANL